MIDVDSIEQLRISYRRGLRVVWANVWRHSGKTYVGNYYTSSGAAICAQFGPAPQHSSVVYRLRIRFKEGVRL